MDDRVYRSVKYVAVVLVVAWIGYSFYDSFFTESSPGTHAYLAGNKRFEDGDYEQALREYEAALSQDPEAPHFVRAKARALMQLGRDQEALEWFNRALELQPYFAGTYANRGILYDRMGEYTLAIADYERALELDSEIAEGPHWLVRFLRNQPEKPPTIKDRAEYLKQELQKPPSERLLRVPEADAQQRSYEQ